VLLAVGAIMLATAIARSRSFPTWAGITFAVGLALWCPLLPPAVRVADGLLIGIGGIGLACFGRWITPEDAESRPTPRGVA